jgi:hypothetical protein
MDPSIGSAADAQHRRMAKIAAARVAVDVSVR